MKAAVATLQDELCDASEEAQRLAEWQATCRISSLSDQVPFSCSAAGSSADPLEPPAGTQLGTIMEQAAAIISYSQAAPDHTSPVKAPQLAPGWLSQAVLHAAQTQKRDTPEAPPYASQTASAAAAGGGLRSPPDQADAATGGVLQCPSNQADAAADTAAEAVCLPALGGQERDQSNAATASPAAALQPGNAASHYAIAAIGPAQESHAQAGAVTTAAVLQDGSAPQALPAMVEQRSAAAAWEEAPAGVPAAEAEEAADAAMSQETEEGLGDIAATEVQLPDQTSLLHAASFQDQRCSSAAAPAGRHHLTESPQSEVHQADAGMSPKVTVGAGVGAPQAASVREALSASPQRLPGSPTPDLQLQLTYLEPELAARHAEPAEETASQQLRLQLTTEPPMPEANAANVTLDESCRDGVRSPARLDLNLDTQLPEQPADKAPSVCAPAGGQKSPALNRGWWNQPWSVAQHVQPAEDADSLPAGLQPHAQLHLCVYVTGCVALAHVSVTGGILCFHAPRYLALLKKSVCCTPTCNVKQHREHACKGVPLSAALVCCSWLLECIKL